MALRRRGAKPPLVFEHFKAAYVQVGEMAGPTITLPGAASRSAAIELSGQGEGSVSKELMPG